MIIYQGEAFNPLTLKVTYSNGQKYDFTGATEIVAKFKHSGLEKKLSLTQVTNISLGQFDIALSAAETAALRITEAGSIVITITKPLETRIALIENIKVRKA